MVCHRVDDFCCVLGCDDDELALAHVAAHRAVDVLALAESEKRLGVVARDGDLVGRARDRLAAQAAEAVELRLAQHVGSKD